MFFARKGKKIKAYRLFCEENFGAEMENSLLMETIVQVAQLSLMTGFPPGWLWKMWKTPVCTKTIGQNQGERGMVFHIFNKQNGGKLFSLFSFFYILPP